MNDQQQRIFYLLEQYEKRLVSEKEMEELDRWYLSLEGNDDLTDQLNEQQQAFAKERLLNRLNADINRYLQAAQLSQPKRVVRLWPSLVAAACLLFCISAAYFLFLKPGPGVEYAEKLDEDFAPGSNKAVLTLASGKQLILSGAKNGQLAVQGNTTVNKTAEGELVYGLPDDVTTPVTNTMTTPRGGQYRVILADGTVARLNAASSITYPSAFKGSIREVQITGEVYFEVAHNAEQPFRVKSRGQLVEVLGTHFNVNAYENEGAIKTTLLEGSVAVSASGVKKVIKPGQQSVLIGNAIRIDDVEISEEVAWKDGYFVFTDAGIEEIMRQVSRWYDVDVEFKGPVSKDTFTGRISRFKNISQVLKMFKPAKSVKLTFEGRRIMVQ